MEKIKVNMSPNPLDVQTIHASQNDGEARQWEFELHNNGELIDTSDVSEQMFFKAYKGGTEQILPENTSTPTTSPFLGDIRYPQGLLTDQEFLYRESPTEEDGLAKITDIKGNTLVWNQLVQNGSFADGTNNWVSVGTTLTASNNELTIKLNVDGGSRGVRQAVSIKANHTYLIRYFEKPNRQVTSRCFFYANGDYFSPDFDKQVTANVFNEVIHKITADRDYDYFYIQPASRDSNPTTTDTFILKNVNIVDLTQMGLDSLTEDEFTSLFSLPYYDYNQGTLLSFNGNGLKTVGANILDLSSEFDRVGVSYTVDEDGWFTVTNIAYPNLYRNRFLLPSALTNGSALIEIDTSKTASTNFGMVLYNDTIRVGTTTTKLESKAFDRISFNWSTAGSTTFRVMVTTMPTIGTYEPYTSSTLSLPISTYFPNGMDGVGTDYDELTNAKATTRMARIDLGTLSYSYESTQIFFYATIPDIVGGMTSATKPNVIIPGYSFKGETVGWANMGNLTYGFTGRQIRIKNESYTTVDSFKQAINGTKIVYPLETPIETSFTTASLVTENAEIPLSNEDGTLIGKCTEQLSAEPGFHDAKIKLSDSDGECYSNKLQLHVERSPQ